MNDGLFSMEEKREGNDGKAMVSFMVPAALKNELQERARQLHTPDSCTPRRHDS